MSDVALDLGVVLIRHPDHSFQVIAAPKTARVPFDLLANPQRSDRGVDVVGLMVYFGFSESVRYRIAGKDGDDVLLERA